jgi:hypothetical protein
MSSLNNVERPMSSDSSDDDDFVMVEEAIAINQLETWSKSLYALVASLLMISISYVVYYAVGDLMTTTTSTTTTSFTTTTTPSSVLTSKFLVQVFTLLWIIGVGVYALFEEMTPDKVEKYVRRQGLEEMTPDKDVGRVGSIAKIRAKAATIGSWTSSRTSIHRHLLVLLIIMFCLVTFGTTSYVQHSLQSEMNSLLIESPLGLGLLAAVRGEILFWPDVLNQISVFNGFNRILTNTNSTLPNLFPEIRVSEMIGFQTRTGNSEYVDLASIRLKVDMVLVFGLLHNMVVMFSDFRYGWEGARSLAPSPWVPLQDVSGMGVSGPNWTTAPPWIFFDFVKVGFWGLAGLVKVKHRRVGQCRFVSSCRVKSVRKCRYVDVYLNLMRGSTFPTRSRNSPSQGDTLPVPCKSEAFVCEFCESWCYGRRRRCHYCGANLCGNC